jgi:hypothetical protein
VTTTLAMFGYDDLCTHDISQSGSAPLILASLTALMKKTFGQHQVKTTRHRPERSREILIEDFTH